MTTHTASLSSNESQPRPNHFLQALLSFLVGVVVTTTIYLLFFWPWMSTWGATKAELEEILPGDNLVSDPTLQTTKGLTIEARPEEIYPWLLQIGVDRGGMYSYDWLENLFGLNVHTVEAIVPEYQTAQAGDFWRFTPEDYVLNPGPGLWVKELRPNTAVLLCFGMEDKPDEACMDTWQFVLEPQADGTTRLLLRSRMAIEPELPIKLTYFVQFIMERKMLLEIRERAESLAPTESGNETAVIGSATPAAESTESAGLPNPASVYCEEQGYTLEMREGEGGAYGVCVFPDGSECDEWAFYRNECRPGEVFATLTGDGWHIYHNLSAGYTFHFPADAILEPGHDPVQTVTIRGPLVDGDYWPMIFISHPQDNEAYRIPAGVELVTWLTEQNLLMAGEVEPAAEVRLEDVEIDGMTAVHTRFERSPQSYAFDKYYFAHKGQLYTLVIIHTADKEDWEIYSHFLESFHFES